MEPTNQSTLRGEIEIRPWRVGTLVDTADEHDVRRAIASLAQVWGGYFLPILDRNIAHADLRDAAQRFQLDSLYADDPSPELEELLRAPGYFWQGRGEWGPFTASAEAPMGLLTTKNVGLPHLDVEAVSSMHLTMLAARGGQFTSSTSSGSVADPPASTVTPIAATARHLQVSGEWNVVPPRGLFVIDEFNPATAVNFWNMRSLGGWIRALSSKRADWNEDVLKAVSFELGLGSNTEGSTSQELPVFGLERLVSDQRQRLTDWSLSHGWSLIDALDDWQHPGWRFTGYEPVAANHFRVPFQRGVRAIPIPLPRLPFVQPAGYWSGIVGAVVRVFGEEGLDPRRTLDFPKTRRHSALLQPALSGSAEHLTITERGPAFGVQAGADEVLLPLPSNLAVFEQYFAPSTASFTQSEQGRFDTWAAESFGGTLGGLFTQPGLRSGLEKIADNSSGTTMQQLESHIERNRGDWPEELFALRHSSREYAKAVTHQLLQSDLIVPTLDAECTHCRVTSRIEADDLGSRPQCGYCGHSFSLALSHALTKPVWRYRLARHALPERIKAMMPTVATASTLAQLHHVEGPRISHVMGLEVKVSGHETVEVDIAALLSEIGTVILGEVKSHNRIDAHDTENLGRLQRILWKQRTNCTLLFVTLKDSFSDEERSCLRTLAQANARSITDRRSGATATALPLLWTRQDISLPWSHRDHPWRRSGSVGSALFAMAEASTRLHLGLESIEAATRLEDGHLTSALTWSEH